MRNVASIFVVLLFISWSTQDESDAAASSTIEERERVARSVNEFGHTLMLQMMRENVDKNVIISPTGVAGLLAMTLLGSAGATYDELAKALGFSEDILANRRNHEQFGDLLQMLNETPKAPKVGDVATETKPDAPLEATDNNTLDAPDIETKTLYADAIVVDDKTRIRNVYRDYLERVYRGDAINAHFEDGDAAQHLINDWVKNHTGGKIDAFLSEPVPANTKVVLLSALYFSGQWARPFLPEYTRQMTFHRPSGEVLTDLMLSLGKFNYTYKSHLNLHMIAFPYNDTDTTMYVLKPFRKNTSLTEVLEKLDYSVIEQLIQNLTNQECVVRFPKMELSSKASLQNSLKAIGVKTMFSPGEANFALLVDVNTQKSSSNDLLERILEDGNETNKLRDALDRITNPGVHVDTVLHDVKMSINEYGTVAVAATGGFMARTASLFYADSPFYMFIRNERTKLITFSAAIFDPTEV
ncbi:serpin (serine protease inhibitor) domain-containing protein [Phthorimaea operculella]|nr:serpin (serine protease inhibitor) domain-containing protein [Phthorimaea operculella]